MGKIATLATLKVDYGSVGKYIGSFKVGLDEAFVKYSGVAKRRKQSLLVRHIKN